MSDFTTTPNLGLYKPNYNRDVGVWGDHLNLNADKLDASFGTLEGSFLPLTGGTVTGPLNYTATGGTVGRSAQDRAADVKHVADYAGSIQAAIDALPVTGGEVRLSPNTTYVVTAQISTTKPNVRLVGPHWNTILRRDPAFTGTVIRVIGDNSVVEGFTVDGNSVAHVASELDIGGKHSVVRNMQVMNSAGSIFIGVFGDECRVTGNTITGLGIPLNTERGQGVWAFTDKPTMIDHNTISGINTSAIGCEGEGSQIIGNYITNCHTYLGGPGGAIYMGTGTNLPTGKALVIADNFIGRGGGPLAQGIESWMPNTIITGNVIDNMQGQAILLFISGATVTGNTIRNTGDAANTDGIFVTANVSDFVISGNHIYDDRTTPVMRTGIWVNAGASDRYTITGNLISGFTTAFAVRDQGTGLHKIVRNNTGVDDILRPINVAATVGLFPGAIHNLVGTGTITALNTLNYAIGDTATILPASSGVVFTGGAGAIANTITTVANVPVIATFNGTSWFLK